MSAEQSREPARYRSVPTEVTAMRWTPDDDAARLRALEWVSASGGRWGIDRTHPSGSSLVVFTIAGQPAIAHPGEWVVAEPVPGRFYPCADEVFAKRYRPASDVPERSEAERREVFGDHPVWAPLRELHALLADGCACTEDDTCRAHELMERADEGIRALTETGWQWGWQYGGIIRPSRNEEEAREEVAAHSTRRTLLRRIIGPWTEVR